jgi:YesN/AraC family two-component response regulator
MPDKKIGSVLIVDDETIIREMLQVELEKQYDVYTAEDAVNAFDILDQTALDLVISDINMPGMKGFELIKKVKEKYAGIKTALITAYDVNDLYQDGERV